ncbi:MAG: type II secretion system GspH family protein [Gallionella sp.]|jgi:MSHA biogenesis protein MshO|nr:type II secretion system GspH family protein [Gallionella sp.]MCK9352792.1 type II secretion system GspH family protein [Gallionella sp.]
MKRLNPHSVRQQGFTLVEMIMVIVITGIIGSMVAVFLKSPIQQYVDVARRAELTDIADTAVRRMARDIRAAAPNSVRIAGCGGVPCVEFLQTKDGGRYRVAGAGDPLDFDGNDNQFDTVGAVDVAKDDYVVVGSTQSDGSVAYDSGVGGGLRKVSDVAGAVTLAAGLPQTAELDSHRFAVVDSAQQAVTYACVGALGALDANQNGQAKLMRYWGYGFHAVQQTAAGIASNAAPVTAHSAAVLADKVSACQFEYDVPNQRFGLLAVRLTLTSGNESVSLYHEVHVNNAP